MKMQVTINWMDEAVAGYVKQLKTGMAIYNNVEKAIEYANENSCAGKKAKETALSQWK